MTNRQLIELARQKVESFDPGGLKDSGLFPLDGMFFPSIYYPPLTMYSPVTTDALFKDYTPDENARTALYVHIPFCPVHCMYCHWAISLGSSEEDMDRYLSALEKEMDLWKDRLQRDTISPTSVLIGGGTPSLLLPRQIDRLLRSIWSKFDLGKCTQFTCEVEPRTICGDVGSERLKVMKNLGVDRISPGIQAFDDTILKKMGRPHNADEAKTCINRIREAGFDSISIDLIYGYPGCTPEIWIETLKTAFSLEIDACQLYRLRIVPHGDKVGAIKEHFDKKLEDFTELGQIYIMKELGIILSQQNGFKENFRRIFSKSPEHISHYLRDYCCLLSDVIGIGLSSWSNIQGRLALNTGEDLKSYYSRIDSGEIPINRGKVRTKDDDLRRSLILPLKNCGLVKDAYEKLNGIPANAVFGEKIERLRTYGLLGEDPERLTLTGKGCFFADETVMQFYDPQYLPFPSSSYADGALNPHNS